METSLISAARVCDAQVASQRVLLSQQIINEFEMIEE